MTKTFHLIETLENFAPPKLACEWDNSGWQVELNNKKTEKIMLCLSVTKEVLEQAINQNYDLIIAHHPVIFNSLKKISSQNYTNQIIIDAIKNNIQIYAMHTNLDNVKGGIADVLADMLNLENTTIIDKIDDANGTGRIGTLEAKISLEELIKQVKTLLNVDNLKVINNSNKQQIKKIAVCPGSGGDLLNRLNGVDAYITADIKYHTAIESENIILIDAGHLETERIILPKIKELLKDFDVDIKIAQEQEPWLIL